MASLLRALIVAAGPLAALSAITGFSLDIEPSANSTDEVAFINTMAQYRSLLGGTGLILSADAGTAWVTSPLWNVTVNGTDKCLFEWVVDLCNETIIMDYDRNSTNLLVRAAPYLAYADARVAEGLNKSITVGVAIAPPGAPSTWWQTASLAELTALVHAANPSLESHASFSSRFAIFYASTLFNSSQAAPCPACSFTEPRALWYVDDDWVYDAGAQSAFFDFACAQHVVQLYDAPHAGSRPHIGANPADEALYRSFVEAAGTRGIDVQFMSGLNDFDYDMAFIRSVNASLPRNATCHWH
jgi:hypothetical protein